MEAPTHYSPRASIAIEVPPAGNMTAETVTITPSIISAKWTRNNHLVADELTVTVGWEEGGCDPRFLKNATCEFYMWDDAHQEPNGDYDLEFLRFVGICVKVSRKLGEAMQEVTLTFHDYTTLFINMKPFPTDGMPEYSDDIQEIWDKMCDYTGAVDPSNNKKIKSSVEKLRGKYPNATGGGLILGSSVDQRTMGEIVNKRFHDIDKPSIHKDASAWEMWQWCMGALGYVSYISKDTCIVMTTTEHYLQENAPSLIYGQNILEFEESSDATISGKGIRLTSFDHLNQRNLEAVYPIPGDERLKMTRAVAKRANKEGREVNTNDISGDYQDFEYHGIQTQEALDFRAKQAYEEFSRQQLTGTLKTADMALVDPDGDLFDILDLNANDSVVIGIDPNISNAKDEETAYRILVDQEHYNEGLARIIARNFGSREYQAPIFHVTSMDVDYKDGTCMIEIKFHNLVHIVDGKTITIPPVEL